MNGVSGLVVLVGLIAVLVQGASLEGQSQSCDQCSQRCDQTTGKCSCLQGYRLSSDNHTCNVLDEPPVLLYKANGQLKVHYLEENFTAVILQNAPNLLQFTFGRKQALYWIDSVKKIVYKTQLDEMYEEKETKVMVDDGLESPSGLCMDWSTSTLYIADSGRGKIIACTSTKEDHCAVINKNYLPGLQGIIVDPDRRTLMWSQWGTGPSNGSIMVSELDGSEARALVQKLDQPTSLTLDRTRNSVFWLARNSSRQSVWKFNLGARTDQFVSTMAGLPEKSTISVLTDLLYIDNGEKVVMVDKLSGQKARFLTDKHFQVQGAHVYHPVLYTTDTPNVCSTSSCTHVCLPRKKHPGYSCTCPLDMYRLSESICKDRNAEHLVVSGQHGVYKVPLQYIGVNSARGRPLLDGLLDVDSLLYNRESRNVIYHDKKEKCIMQFNTRHPKAAGIMYSGVTDVHGMALDEESGNIYWTTNKDKVYAAKLDGSTHRMIKQFPDGAAHQLRGIAVDPVGGYMYVSDWGFRPQIYRCAMDGSNCSKFSSSGEHPNMIVVERNASGVATMLYWTDSSLNQIRYKALDGSHRQGAMDLNMKKDPHPYGLAVTKTKIFFTDLNSKQLHYLRKSDPSRVYDIDLNLGPLTGLDLITDSDIDGTTACSNDNGGCSNLCLPKPHNQRSCTCPYNITLNSDGKTCSGAFDGRSTTEKVGDTKSHSYRDLIILVVFLSMSALTILVFAIVVLCYRRRKRTDEEKNALVPSTSSETSATTHPKELSTVRTSPLQAGSFSSQSGSYDTGGSTSFESQPLVPNTTAAVVTYRSESSSFGTSSPPKCESVLIQTSPSMSSGKSSATTPTSVQRMSPASKYSTPSPGKKSSPYGHHISPTGQQTSSLQKYSPSGRKLSPSSQKVSPSSREISPMGKQTSPDAKELSQSGQMSTPPPGPIIVSPGSDSSSGTTEQKTSPVQSISPGQKTSPGLSVNSGQSTSPGQRASPGQKVSPAQKKLSPSPGNMASADNHAAALEQAGPSNGREEQDTSQDEPNTSHSSAGHGSTIFPFSEDDEPVPGTNVEEMPLISPDSGADN